MKAVHTIHPDPYNVEFAFDNKLHQVLRDINKLCAVGVDVWFGLVVKHCSSVVALHQSL